MRYFSIRELTFSITAIKENIPNVPTKQQEFNLRMLVNNTLDPARAVLGMPISVSSGFRSKELNKAVKGSSTSQHLKGQAADLDCDNNTLLFEIIRNMGCFDQLIWEHGNDGSPDWVHVSYVSETKNRKQVLRAYRYGTRTRYVQI